MNHSHVVGGSTAKRVINCPGSVALVQKAPPAPSSAYADKGTLLHNVMADILNDIPALLGTTYEDQTLDQEMVDDKINPALAALDDLDPKKQMEIAVETRVGFGDYMPGVFGSCDLLGRIGDTAYVIDWKFGDGVSVSAEENEQLMFYAAAAMRTPEAAWVFKDAKYIECIIIQPPHTKRWQTTPARIAAFEKTLKLAVKAAALPDAQLKAGEHCRFCPAKPTCPLMTGAAERALKVKIDAIDDATLGAYASNALLLQGWIDSINALVETKIRAGAVVPGWKLVAKQGRRAWVKPGDAEKALVALGINPVKTDLISPAQAEKLLKKNLPEGLAVSVSSGDTVVPESDSRPAVVLLGQSLKAALSKLSNGVL